MRSFFLNNHITQTDIWRAKFEKDFRYWCRSQEMKCTRINLDGIMLYPELF